MTNPKQGWLDEPAEEYNRPDNQGLRSSHVIAYAKSPLHYYHAVNGSPDQPDREESAAFTFGRLFHAMFDPTIKVVSPPDVDGRTKEGKALKETFAAFTESHEGIFVASSFKDHETAKAMHASVMKTRAARELIEDSIVEQSGYYLDPNLGLIRARPDFRSDKRIADLKSTTDGGAAMEKFENSIFNYGYHLQAAHYRYVVDHLDKVGNESLFCWIVVEKKPPFAVAVYEESDELAQAGDSEWKTQVQRIRYSEQHGAFPSYNGGVATRISLSEWRMRKLRGEV